MLISNIQRFCLKDGPGIRTTVFVMGCSVRCFWCSNPENLTPKIKHYKKNGVDCTYGKEISNSQILKEILKDRLYYATDGGVTFSGGECLLELHNNLDLLKAIKAENISICIETSLSVPNEYLEAVKSYIDWFYVDLKEFTSNAERIGLNVGYVLNNLSLIRERNDRLVFRLPIVRGYNDSIENLSIIKAIIHSYQPLKVELFQIHDMAKQKYENLGLKAYTPEKMTKEELLSINTFLNYNSVEILEI